MARLSLGFANAGYSLYAYEYTYTVIVRIAEHFQLPGVPFV